MTADRPQAKEASVADTDRIRGGSSWHDEHKPELCPGTIGCGSWRVVDCCGREPDTDVIECARCGKQQSASCTFDEDFA